MFKKLLSLSILTLLITFLVACGGSSGGGDDTTSTTTDTRSSASSAIQATSTVDSMTSITSTVTNPSSRNSLLLKSIQTKDGKLSPLVNVFNTLASKGVFSPDSAQTRVAESCSNGGSYDIDATTGTTTFNGCSDGTTVIDGTVEMTATSITMNINVSTYSDGVLLTYMEFNDFTMNYTSDSVNTSVAYNGNVNVNNYITREIYNLTFENFNTSVVMADTSVTSTMNGLINFDVSSMEDESPYSGFMKFTNFVNKLETTTDSANQYINGRVQIYFNQTHCGAGIYDFTTIEPITFNVLTGDITGGILDITVNEDFTIRITYNSNGTVTIGGDVYSLYELQNSCEIINLNPEVPETTTFDGTSEESIPTGYFTFTLSWDGPTSDIDSHLTYYSELNPTSSSVPSAHLYYSAGNEAPDCSDCRASVELGSTGYYAYLDVDDTEGYGPEHITMPNMPDGYYVVAAYEYDMDYDTSTTANFSIQLGEQVFTFPTHTYLSSDGVSDLVRICDIRVENGVATILPADTNVLVNYDGRTSNDKK